MNDAQIRRLAVWHILLRVSQDLAASRDRGQMMGEAAEQVEQFMFDLSGAEASVAESVETAILASLHPQLAEALYRDAVGKKLPYGWALDIWGNLRRSAAVKQLGHPV